MIPDGMQSSVGLAVFVVVDVCVCVVFAFPLLVDDIHSGMLGGCVSCDGPVVAGCRIGNRPAQIRDQV